MRRRPNTYVGRYVEVAAPVSGVVAGGYVLGRAPFVSGPVIVVVSTPARGVKGRRKDGEGRLPFGLLRRLTVSRPVPGTTPIRIVTHSPAHSYSYYSC